MSSHSGRRSVLLKSGSSSCPIENDLSTPATNINDVTNQITSTTTPEQRDTWDEFRYETIRSVPIDITLLFEVLLLVRPHAYRESMTANGNNTAAMGNYMDNSPNVMNMSNMSRQSMSPSPSQMNGGGGGGGGGNGGGNNNNMLMNGLPMNAGHQMDLNNLYDMVVEFSDILKNNREMTRGIVQSAEEIMVCPILTSSR